METKTEKKVTLNKDGTPRAGWGTKTRSTAPRKTKAGNGQKFPVKISSQFITLTQQAHLIQRASAENKTMQDIVRELIDNDILSVS